MADPVAAAVHELRRPLQVAMLALAGRGPADCALACLAQAAAALELLEHELGLRSEPPGDPDARTAARELLVDAGRRWLGLEWAGAAPLQVAAADPDLELPGDRRSLGAALDNLIANALEHGGGGARVELRPHGAGAKLIVSNPDRTSAATGGSVGGTAAAQATGGVGPRRGQGLAIAERTAAGLGGRLDPPRRVGSRIVSTLALPAVKPATGARTER